MRKIQAFAKSGFVQPDYVAKPVPAPTEGWDAISPLAAMDPKRAPILINWVPRPGWVELRAGSQLWATPNTVAAVESLMVYRGPTGEKMFAAAGSAIYDVTTALGGPPTVVTGLGSARWQYVNFTPTGGTNVIHVANGTDQLLQYNGTSWTNPAITGLPNSATTANIIHVWAAKRRLWYVLVNTTIAAFMPTDAITGAISGYLDLGALWSKGGFLMAIASWTIDGGNGPQDYVVFMSSRGQAAIYSGTDPTDATKWSLVGVFDLAPPLGRRCMTRVGSDVALITQQGVLPLSQALPFDPSADRSVAITARIQNAMATAALQSGSNFGWQIISFPNQQLAVLNVPQVTNTTQVQYVMNALSGGWCQFQGWSANCFEIFNDNLYFGDNGGGVWQGYLGGTDGLNNIQADMQCAFNYFDDPGRTKHMTMVQPLLLASGQITPFIEVDADFGTSTASSPIQILAGGAAWDSAVWDTDIWPNTSIQVTNWLTAEGLGHALAVRMKVNVAPQSTSSLGEFDIGLFDSAVFDGINTLAPVLQVNAFNAVMEMGGLI